MKKFLIGCSGRAAMPQTVDKPAETISADQAEDAIDLMDALETIAELGQGIRHADTKASLVLATLAALGPWILGEIRLRPGAHWQGWVLAGVSGALLVTILGTVLAVYRTLVPRVTPSDLPSKYGWPTLRSLSAEAIIAQNTRDSALQAWSQAIVLARICAVKFSWAQRSIQGAISCVLLGITLVTLVSLWP